MNASVYLDHAATTPVRPEVVEAIQPLLHHQFGNPSSIHRWGREARGLLETARDRVAAALGANRREIYFTSGGTEADNLGVLGCWSAEPVGRRIIISAIEHKAVIGAAKHAARAGAELVVVAVDNEGLIDLGALEHALPAAQPPNHPAALVSIMWANNEVGAVQPMREVAERCRAAGALLHTDAVQAMGREPVRVDEVSCDLLTISGHKIGAPKGVGALFVRTGVRIEPLLHGGGQEREVRPGTENVVGAVALGVAVELAVRERAQEHERIRRLRDQLEQRVVAQLSDVRVNAGGAHRLPHISNLSFPAMDQEALLISLDMEGVAVSSGSACQSGAVEPSHVLVAMNRVLPGEASIRFSLGRTTTSQEIERAAETTVRVAQRLRTMVNA